MVSAGDWSGAAAVVGVGAHYSLRNRASRIFQQTRRLNAWCVPISPVIITTAIGLRGGIQQRSGRKFVFSRAGGCSLGFALGRQDPNTATSVHGS